MALLICQTCPRYLHDTRSFGPKMFGALAAAGTHPTVRTTRVACVGGCPTPGNVALDSVGKPRVRFSGLTENDADALLEAAAAYEASTSGTPGDWSIPRDSRQQDLRGLAKVLGNAVDPEACNVPHTCHSARS